MTTPQIFIPDPRFNSADLALQREAMLHRMAKRGLGGAFSTVSPAGGGPAATPTPAVSPLNEMPATGRPLHYVGVLACPAPGSSDVSVLEFITPAGFISIMKRIFHRYMPAGWTQGSGELIFRLSVDGAFAPGFDNLTTQLGSETDPYFISGAIIARPNQTTRYTITVDPAFAGPTGAGNNVIVGIDGWLIPEGLLPL